MPGALSSNKGEDFRTVLEEFASVVGEGISIPRPNNGKWKPSGAIVGNGWSLAWRIMDAQFWGVPQRRKRICLVADFEGHTAPEIVFERVEFFGSTGDTDKDTFNRCAANGRRPEIQPIETGVPRYFEPFRETGQDASEAVTGCAAVLDSDGRIAYTLQDREGKPGGGKGPLI